MTTLETMKEIGRKFDHTFGGLKVRVVVQDVKIVYGQKRFLVCVDGQESNSIWINA